jgi:crotonobetainyl-CoA:carnitine CoA-transferase CaiB-like acyl-CoA transferase
MGPYATQTLGDLGADVIKIEPPQGDLTRHNAPGRHAGMSSLFLQLNRSKRSVVLDLKDAAGRDALLQMVRSADAMVCNVRPKAMERLGLGYEVLAGINPKLVYCALVAFGQDGPYAERAAVCAGLDRRPGCRPGGPYALLAALLHRERSGQGQMVEVPMFESMVQFTMTPHLYGQSFRPPIGGTGYPRIFARRPFKTLDGHLGATAYAPAH